MVLVAALAAGGCYADARVEPAYVETTFVPVHVHTYPHYYYEGRTVYLVDNRWYYRHSNGRWVYYREEPPVLHRQRLTVQKAPPAPPRRVEPARDRYRDYPSREAPPAYYRDDRGPDDRDRDDRDKDPRKKKRYDDRDRRDHDDRDRDGHRRDDGDHRGRY